MEKKLKIISMISVLSIMLMGCVSLINEWMGLPDDNIYEEAVEEVIKEHTGLDIDLTPY